MCIGLTTHGGRLWGCSAGRTTGKPTTTTKARLFVHNQQGVCVCGNLIANLLVCEEERLFVWTG